ncbi:MAG: hypothetical protein IMZ66_07390, partial [Planctomycetes bacterium]|nr:hypothetical protein [Planctomycetota bacterium]
MTPPTAVSACLAAPGCPWRFAALALVLAAACAAASAPAAAGEPAPTADFYVAPAGNDAWSGTRAAASADGSDGPFATLARARDAVRGLIAKGLKADVTVLVRGGTYVVKDGLALGPEDSGTAEHAVTWVAYPGEVPVLTGGVPLAGWEPWKGDIRVAAIPDGLKPNQLFEGGVRLDLAREPNEGYFKVAAPVKGSEATAFVYREGDFDPAGWDLSEARVFCWPTNNWFTAEPAIAAIDPATRTVTLAAKVSALAAGNRYLFRNVLAALDRPGEAQIDLARRKAYVWPRDKAGTAGEARPIVAATAPCVLAIEGKAPER